MLVLGAEVVVVVGARDGEDVFLECVEGFDVAAFVDEAEADFAEAVVGLEGGEDEGVVLEGVEGGGVYVGGEMGLYGVAEDGGGVLDEAAYVGAAEHVGGEAVLAVDGLGGGEEVVVVEGGHVGGGVGEGEGAVVVEAAEGLVECPVVLASPKDASGAQAKKLSGSVLVSRTPVMGTLYLSAKYWGSMS